MKVLIVDDSVVVRQRLAEMCSEVEGIEIVGQAQDAIQASEYFKNLTPEVVILDIRMTQGNGMDVLKTIKEKNRTTVVIMLTNYPYPQYRKKCMALGADYFFDKSSDPEKVVRVLRKLANKRGIRK